MRLVKSHIDLILIIPFSRLDLCHSAIQTMETGKCSPVSCLRSREKDFSIKDYLCYFYLKSWYSIFLKHVCQILKAGLKKHFVAKS